jgi:hypothetical protein
MVHNDDPLRNGPTVYIAAGVIGGVVLIGIIVLVVVHGGRTAGYRAVDGPIQEGMDP